MAKMQMVDLKRQYQKIKTEVDDVVEEIMTTAQFIHGPWVGAFEEHLAKYLGVKHVISCGSGTDALQIALMALGLKPGDEVITPSFTFIATVEVVALLGLKPVFVDVDADTFTMNIDDLQAAITSKTKAIIPVHLYGQCANMEEILTIAAEAGVPIIEDAAQAIGGDFIFKNGNRVKTGTVGQIGCTSFFPSKNLGAYGDGGAIFTNNDHLAGMIRMIANHGSKERYHHEVVGVNSRLDSIQAAILDIKLKHLDEYCRARMQVADYYDLAFSGEERITTPKRVPYSIHAFHQYTIKLDSELNRDKVKALLEEKGIPSMIYYPIPCHQQKMFQGLDAVVHDMTNTETLTSQVLSLPIHTEMNEDQLQFISASVMEVVNEKEVLA